MPLRGLRPNPGCKPNGRTCRAAEKPARGRRRIPVRSVNQPCSPGVDEAAYVKAGFLAAVAKGEAKSPLLTPEKAIELLGTMQGGYNIHPLIDALDDAKLAPIAAKALSHTLLMFDNFYDVEEKAKAGNEYAKQVMQSWADAEWFLNRPALAEKLTVTVFKVTGETNTDDLSGTRCVVTPGYPTARAGDAEKRP